MALHPEHKITRSAQPTTESDIIRSVVEGVDTSKLKATSQMIVERINPVLLSVLKFIRTTPEEEDKFRPIRDPFSKESFEREREESRRTEAISAMSIIYEDEEDRIWDRMYYAQIWKKIAAERQSECVQNNLWASLKSEHRNILDYFNQSRIVQYEKSSLSLTQQILEREAQHFPSEVQTFLSNAIKQTIELRDSERILHLLKTFIFDTNVLQNDTICALARTITQIKVYEAEIITQFTEEEKEIIRNGHDVVIFPCEYPENTEPHLTTEFEIWSTITNSNSKKFHLVFNPVNIGYWLIPIVLSKFQAPISITVLGRFNKDTALGTYSQDCLNEISSEYSTILPKYTYKDLCKAFVYHFGDANGTITWAKMIEAGIVQRSASFSDFLQTEIELPAIRTQQILNEYDL